MTARSPTNMRPALTSKFRTPTSNIQPGPSMSRSTNNNRHLQVPTLSETERGGGRPKSGESKDRAEGGVVSTERRGSAALLEELHAMSANKDTPKCQICNQYCMGTNVVETKDESSGEVLLCHSTCFNCLECGASLADHRCYRDPSDPINSRYCLQCYSGGSHSVPRVCSACSLPFQSDFISLPNNRGHFHPSCLNCAICRVNLVDKPMLFDKTKAILKCSPPCDLFLE